MSRRSVGELVGLLVEDKDLRLQLASDPIATVAAWLNAGFALTPTEIDGILQTDARVWSDIDSRNCSENSSAGYVSLYLSRR
jgi:gamma-glutamylcysteine synthetase